MAEELDQAAYDKAYNSEMEKLDGEAAPATTEPQEIEPEKVEVEPEKVDPEKAPVDIESLQRDLESTKKALRDTKQWATQNAQSLRAIENQLRETERAKKRPEILDAFDGLEDAIKHVAKVPEPQQHDPEQVFYAAVEQALPDLSTLLADPAFNAAAKSKLDEMGNERFNPISAIRELGNLRADHLRNKAVSTAVEAARKDFEARQKKQSAMEVLGGNSKPGAVAKEKDFAAMSDEEFRKEQARVLGY